MPDALFCAAKVRKSPQHAHFYSEKINFAGMKRRFFLIFVLLTGAFSALAQIRVEMNNGGAQLRPMNLSDYDRHEEPFALTHADSVDYQSHVVRAYNYLATDSLPQARTHLKQALKITNKAPGTWILQHTLGRIEMAEGNYMEAAGVFDAVLKRIPTQKDVRLDRATAHLELGHTREALEDINLLLAGEPSDSMRSHLLFMRASAQMKARLYTEARTDLKEVLRLTPGNENAMLLLCAADWKGGRRESAMLMLNGFINAHPKNTAALALRADCLAELGRREAAMMDLEEALRIEPSNVGIQRQLDGMKRTRK